MRRSGRLTPPALPGDQDAPVWHDLECGSYTADLGLWLELAETHAGRVIEIGAGSGRVALTLARAGHPVYALDRDHRLLEVLRARAGELEVTPVCADACAFSLAERFSLCIVPMQTVHLLEDRSGFLRCVHAILRPEGLLAVALLGDGVEPFEAELEPDRTVHAGVLYESRPTALRVDPGMVTLERRRERSDATGLHLERHVVRLASLSTDELVGEAAQAGFAPSGGRIVPPTEDRAGSAILLLRRRATPVVGPRPGEASAPAAPGRPR